LSDENKTNEKTPRKGVIFHFGEKLADRAEAAGLIISSEAVRMLDNYYSILQAESRKVNLVGNLDAEEVLNFLFLDSLAGLQFINNSAEVIDVGCGAGFPGLVLKIASPGILLTLMDSNGKKINFVKKICGHLGLEGVNFECRRAEVAGKDPLLREKFDVSVSKGLAGLAAGLELCAPLVKVGGKVILWKGANYRQEIEKLGEGYKKLGLGQPEVGEFEIPGTCRKTFMLAYNKVKSTPETYPRSFQAIKRKALS